MAKVMELETDQKEVDEVTNQNIQQTKPESEMEKALNANLKRAYVLGISTGMKTMCGIVIETLNKNRNLNPAKQLAVLRQTISKHVAKQREFDERQKVTQTTNSEKQEQNDVKPKEGA